MNPPPSTPPDFNRAAIEAVADPAQRLRVIMKRLLDPGGCPWDREQNHATLRQYLIEEAHEAAEAIDARDARALCEELGDVALQIVFHAELAERSGEFTHEDVYQGICRKLIDRHPHVFGDAIAADSQAVLKNWEEIKREEKRRAAADSPAPFVSAVDGVPRSLPALQRAARVQEKASNVGFDWERAADVASKVREEVEEFLNAADGSESGPQRMDEEFGDLLFSLVNLSRFLGIHAEESLGRATAKFTRRFKAVERAADDAGRNLRSMTLAEMDALWNQAKDGETR